MSLTFSFRQNKTPPVIRSAHMVQPGYHTFLSKSSEATSWIMDAIMHTHILCNHVIFLPLISWTLANYGLLTYPCPQVAANSSVCPISSKAEVGVPIPSPVEPPPVNSANITLLI
jgi:hypothetical protein